MNKEVIIDGVNVVWCNYYFYGDCHIAHDGCTENPNCIYKQLQRKEQECEELKQKNKSISDIADGLQKRNHHLTEENERLQAENEELKKKKEENDTFYLKKYANKDSECLELQNKCSSYQQALEAIRNELVCIRNDSITHHLIKTKCEALRNYINEVLKDE